MFYTPHTLAAGWHNQRHAQCYSRCVLRAGRAVGGGSFFHDATVRQNTNAVTPIANYGFTNSGSGAGHDGNVPLRGGVVGAVANTTKK